MSGGKGKSIQTLFGSSSPSPMSVGEGEMIQSSIDATSAPKLSVGQGEMIQSSIGAPSAPKLIDEVPAGAGSGSSAACAGSSAAGVGSSAGADYENFVGEGGMIQSSIGATSAPKLSVGEGEMIQSSIGAPSAPKLIDEVPAGVGSGSCSSAACAGSSAAGADNENVAATGLVYAAHDPRDDVPAPRLKGSSGPAVGKVFECNLCVGNPNNFITRANLMDHIKDDHKSKRGRRGGY